MNRQIIVYCIISAATLYIYPSSPKPTKPQSQTATQIPYSTFDSWLKKQTSGYENLTIPQLQEIRKLWLQKHQRSQYLIKIMALEKRIKHLREHPEEHRKIKLAQSAAGMPQSKLHKEKQSSIFKRSQGSHRYTHSKPWQK